LSTGYGGNIDCFQNRQEAASYQVESEQRDALNVFANNNIQTNGGNFHPHAVHHQQQAIPSELQMNAPGVFNLLNMNQQVYQNIIGVHGQYYQSQGMIKPSFAYSQNDQLQTTIAAQCQGSSEMPNTVTGQAAEAFLADCGGALALVAPQCLAPEPVTNSQATSYQNDWNHIASLLTDDVSSVSLMEWVERERQRSGQDEKPSLVRKLSVAYGIGKLLELSSVDHELCSIDNFVVHELFQEFKWVVVGIEMLTPRVQVTLQSILYLRDFEEMVNDESMKGRGVKATVLVDDSTSAQQVGDFDDVRDEMKLCCVLGELLHFLFSGDHVQNTCQPQEETCSTNVNEDDLGGDAIMVQPTKQKTRELSFSQFSINSGYSGSTAGTHRLGQLEENIPTKLRPLIDYGCPPSISQLVGDLLSSCDELFRSDSAFKSLSDATGDIHFLLEEPNIFFERVIKSRQGQHLLASSNDIRLFGREAEITKIMDVYNRVATGKSEHVIVEGHSG
jgi:hypothetical protein